MEPVEPCSFEEFQALKLKSFRLFPRALLKMAIKELPDYATVVYLTLYDLAEINKRHPGTIVISHRALSQEVGKSESSIRRALDTLKDLGYIEVKQRGELHKTYLPNIIRLSCPKALALNIQAAEPNRKPHIASLSYKLQNPQSARLEAPEKPKLASCDAGTGRLVKLYEQYQAEVQCLLSAGATPLAASQQAYSRFSKEDATALQQYILELPRRPEHGFLAPAFPGSANGCSKLNTIRIHKTRDQDLLLTIEKKQPVDNIVKTETQSTTSSFTAVDFKKINSVVYLLGPDEKAEIIRKIKAMHRCHEIHSKLLETYKNNINSLIKEIIFQVQHRDLKRFYTAKHALNAAAKMLRQGTWSTPRKLLQHNTKKREEYALQLKQKENELATAFFEKNKLELGLRRINM